MAKRRNVVSSSQQASLFSEPKMEESTHEPVQPEQAASIETPQSVETTPPKKIICPKCKAEMVAPSMNLEHKGEYFCQGACSYGENFYFKP